MSGDPRLYLLVSLWRIMPFLIRSSSVLDVPQLLATPRPTCSDLSPRCPPAQRGHSRALLGLWEPRMLSRMCLLSSPSSLSLSWAGRSCRALSISTRTSSAGLCWRFEHKWDRATARCPSSFYCSTSLKTGFYTIKGWQQLTSASSSPGSLCHRAF